MCKAIVIIIGGESESWGKKGGFCLGGVFRFFLQEFPFESAGVSFSLNRAKDQHSLAFMLIS